MKVIAKAALIAALGFAAAGSAFADSVTVTGNSISQGQTGSRNSQSLEAAVVDMGAFGSGTVRLTNNTIRQSQSGTGNRQSALIGKIDKNFGSHSVVVSGNSIIQSQGGTRNVQRLKVGVIE